MKKKTIRILSIFLAVLTAVSSLAVTAYALNWDGSSAGGGGAGTSAGPNGYAIMTTDDNCMIAQFFFLHGFYDQFLEFRCVSFFRYPFWHKNHPTC